MNDPCKINNNHFDLIFMILNSITSKKEIGIYKSTDKVHNKETQGWAGLRTVIQQMISNKEKYIAEYTKSKN